MDAFFSWMNTNWVNLALVVGALALAVVILFLAKKYGESGVPGILAALSIGPISGCLLIVVVVLVLVSVLFVPPIFKWAAQRIFKPATTQTVAPVQMSQITFIAC